LQIPHIWTKRAQPIEKVVGNLKKHIRDMPAPLAVAAPAAPAAPAATAAPAAPAVLAETHLALIWRV